MNKASMSLAYGLAGMIVVWCGFEIAKKAVQISDVFQNMSICFALPPSPFMIPALFLLARYPLSHRRMEEIRGELEARRGNI